MKSIYKIVFVAIAIVMFSGCATSRGVVSLDTPVMKEVVQSNGHSIFIESVDDKRVFEARPVTPDIPSLSPVESKDVSIKSRAIARKRNSYGVAMGDILLRENQTVNSVVRKNIEQAFLESGYKIIHDKNKVTNKTTIINVEINKFWSWMKPGFWALTLNTEISTDISMRKSAKSNKKIVSVKASGAFQTAVGGNWVQIMQKALRLYIAEVKTKAI